MHSTGGQRDGEAASEGGRGRPWASEGGSGASEQSPRGERVEQPDLKRRWGVVEEVELVRSWFWLAVGRVLQCRKGTLFFAAALGGREVPGRTAGVGGRLDQSRTLGD
jgi:hypothetical protein